MNVIINMVARNMKRYFRDKAAVFFSFLSVLIVLGLYLFFLGDMQADSIMNSIRDIPGFADREKAVNFLVNGWLVAGLLAVNTITIPLSILSMKVDDRFNRQDSDFNTAPVKRYQIVFGYIVSAWIIGMITSLMVLIAGEGYILMKGGEIMGILQMLEVLGTIILSIIMFSGFFYLIVMYLKTPTQVATVNTLVGTLAGFLGGIYVPIGVLGGAVSAIIKAFPLSYVAALLRYIIMENAVNQVFEGAPAANIAEIREFYGVDLTIGSHTVLPWEILLILLGFTAFFYALSVFLYTKTKRKN